MRIDSEDLRRHYALLPDEALTALERSELTDAAKAIYDEEVARRALAHEAGTDVLGWSEEDAGEDLDSDVTSTPDWLDDAACACAFTMRSAKSDVPIATEARAVLKAAGIPFHVMLSEEEPPQADPTPQYSLRVLVPGGLALHATSVLDRDIFNEEQEGEWRATLESLADDELLRLDPNIFCAGLLDRVARLKTAYKQEMERRKLKPRPS
jgi:hypothetical protein